MEDGHCIRSTSLTLWTSESGIRPRMNESYFCFPLQVQSKKYVDSYPDVDVVGVYVVCLTVVCMTTEGELLLPTPKVDGMMEAGPDGPRMLLLIGAESLDTGMKFVTGTCLKKM